MVKTKQKYCVFIPHNTPTIKGAYEAERHGPAPPSKIDQNIELIN